ncbi:hypothetical protein HDV01_007706 [Terramyces sp. JEL0728]|nr:hypothetical protein HDV01_007706 [Terramyces sp. JEL0728]
MDFKKFQFDLLNDAGIEEKVEVNQRHLIDKILARYSSEFTIYRELLQNSNDAGAESVQIRFNLVPESNKSSQFSLPWIHKSSVESVTYKNNGKAFSEEDFGRLRKIAEGNPDEQKVGFFGVGFYSLFSICEEPFVVSGEQTMGFLWKKDMLYTKRGAVPDEMVTPWTAFYLPAREPFPLPNMTTFAKFLVTSLAFSTNIVNVNVFVNDSLKLCCKRRGAQPKIVEWEPKAYNLHSPQKLFHLRDIHVSQIQMDLDVIDQKHENFTVFMKIVSGDVDVKIGKKFADEMLRTTKKLPPKSTTIKLLYSNFEEYDSTLQASKGSNGIFEDLILSPGKQGKVFIGFPTFQTTGCCAHFAGHFIPTVERESIDFVDKVLKLWNSDLLAVGGTLTRICNDFEVSQIQMLLGNMSLDAQSSAWFCNKAGHLLNTFNFQQSTPSSHVGWTIGNNYLECTRNPIQILSTTGKFHALNNVRLPPEADLKSFLKFTPIIPEELYMQCADFVQKYKQLGILVQVSIPDVLLEIQQRSLGEQEMIGFMKWWISQGKSGNLNQQHIQVLKKHIQYSNGGEVMALGSRDKVPSSRFAPKQFPNSCIPLEITHRFNMTDLAGFFWNWQELTMKEWVSYIATTKEFTEDPVFSEKALATVSKNFGNVSSADKAFIVSIISGKKCIPTDQGLVLPADAYFSNVSLFQDLPKVKFAHKKSISEEFLKLLGVRQHVDLQLVFDRIIDLDWDQTQLIKYLGSIQDKMTEKDVQTLKNTPLFLAENLSTNDRMLASSLYAPNDKFKSFGLPVLHWALKWKYFSDEVDNMEEEYQQVYKPDNISIQFLPCQNSDSLATPTECFTDPKVQLMGFQVIDKSLSTFSSKLGVEPSPNGNLLIERLKTNLPTLENAGLILDFLSTRQSSFSGSNWKVLWSLKFIPVKTVDGFFYAAPTQVYLKPDDQSTVQYAGIFHYVSFGISADAFLRACGMKEQPSPIEIAANLIQNPDRFLENLNNNHSSYLEIIRILATNITTMQQHSQMYKLMKRSAFLPAFQYDDKGSSNNFQLASANDIYLIDDTILAQLFQPLGAPMEEILERFYADLGSDWLSRNVKESYSPVGALKTTQTSIDLQNTILERSPILFYDGHHMRPENELNRNSAALIKAIKVLEIPQINIVRVFKNSRKMQETTACFVNLNGETILAVTEQFDYFDVARVIGGMILKKPRLSDSLLISTFLSTSLRNLNLKGFPVDRILNLKSKPKDAELVQSPSNQTPSKVDPPNLHVPDITPKKEIQTPQRKVSKDFFGMVKQFTKSLGISDSFDSLNTSSESVNETKMDKVAKKPPISKDQRVELAKQLELSIAAVKNSNESNFKAKFPSITNGPPVIHLCNVLTDQELSLVTTVDSIPIFVEKKVSEEGNRIISSNTEGISRFGKVLLFISKCFNLPDNAVHIYLDSDGSTIAFNRNKTLFFNLRYYLAWQYDTGLQGYNLKLENPNTIYYWFMTFCHELAHNFHGPHDSTHEYWMSSFAEQYLGRLVQNMGNILSKSIQIPFPEMFFGNNSLEITAPNKQTISFNAVDALKMVDDSKESADRFKVAIAEKWTNASMKNHTEIKDIVNPYDWTFTTFYKGTCDDLFAKGSVGIDIEKLTVPDPILFYDEVLLFEDELGDNGTSILSIKVKLPFTAQGPDLAQLANINWVANAMTEKHLITHELENYLIEDADLALALLLAQEDGYDYYEADYDRFDNEPGQRQTDDDFMPMRKKKKIKSEEKEVKIKPPKVLKTVTEGMNTGKFTEEEVVKFKEGLELYGRDWLKLTEHVKTRDPNAIRSHAQKYFIKMFRDSIPLPARVLESGRGYTLSGKELDPDSAAAKPYMKARRNTDALPVQTIKTESIKITIKPNAEAPLVVTEMIPSAIPAISLEKKAKKKKSPPKKVKEEFIEDSSGIRTEYAMSRPVRQRKKIEMDPIATALFARPDRHVMIPCERYTGEPGSGLVGSQPFKILMHTSALIIMDLHAHLTSTEVIGFLAGQWHALEIKLALPCKSIEQEHVEDFDDRHYNVELDPASEISTREFVAEKGLSFTVTLVLINIQPTFAPDPSLIDLYNQRNYQGLFRTNTNQDDIAIDSVEPFVAPYDPKLPKSVSAINWFYVGNREEDKNKPKHLTYDSSPTISIVSELEIIKQLLRECGQRKDRVDFKSNWRRDRWESKLDKLKSSISSHFGNLTCIDGCTAEELLNTLESELSDWTLPSAPDNIIRTVEE